jgi:hypothetical protein
VQRRAAKEHAGRRRRSPTPQHAAKCCSAAITRDLPQPPTNTQLLWVGERARTRRRADTLPTSCSASRAEKAVAHSETACSCSMLDVEAKGGGEMRGTKHQQCWSRCSVAAVLVSAAHERGRRLKM